METCWILDLHLLKRLFRFWTTVNFHTVQCEKFLPLRFFVKSTLGDFRITKAAILSIFSYSEVCYFKKSSIFKCEIFPKFKLQSLQISPYRKWQFLTFWNQLKWFHGKSVCEISTLCSSAKWYLSLFFLSIFKLFFVKVHARKDKKTEGNPLILLMMVGRNRKLIWVTCDREINPLQSQVPFSHAKTTQIRFYFWDLWNLGGLKMLNRL